jgi:uncharacterized membrane protein
MTETPEELDARFGERAPVNRKVYGVVGAYLMIVGLLLVILGVMLGLWTYNSPIEQTIRRGMAISAESLNGIEVEGGAVISGASYTPPGPMSYVLGTPVTWIGGLLAFAGLLVFLRSVAPDTEVDGAGDDDGSPDEAAASAQVCSDEPFDTGD